MNDVNLDERISALEEDAGENQNGKDRLLVLLILRVTYFYCIVLQLVTS